MDGPSLEGGGGILAIFFLTDLYHRLYRRQHLDTVLAALSINDSVVPLVSTKLLTHSSPLPFLFLLQ